MYLISYANKVPVDSYTQEEFFDAVEEAEPYKALKSSSKLLMKKVLSGDSGIDKRHFFGRPEEVLPLTAGEFSLKFEEEAPKLATWAIEEALKNAGLKASELDALFVCTCTGFLCPGVSSYVAENVEMKEDVYLQDIVGLGCGAYIPTMRSVSNYIVANPGAKVACVAVEICSAAFYVENDSGVLISNCIFADGASASIWTDNEEGTTGWHCDNFDTLHMPWDREYVRFVNANGKLKNKLHKTVPVKTANAVLNLYKRMVDERKIHVDRLIGHGGGKVLIDEIESILPHFKMDETRKAFQKYGNMSSPSLFFALDEYFSHQPDKNEVLMLSTYGAGFSAHSCTLTHSSRS